MTRTPVLFIVEDEAIVAADIKATLASLGYQVAGTEKSGEAALVSIPKIAPDLVLMDIHLAGTMDGIETAQRIHRDHGIPVIFLTAFADTELLERAKIAEPYGYILKPYEERGLHSVIEMALFKHRMEQRLTESEATLRVMVNATRDLMYLISADGKFLVVNEAFAERAGVAVDELLGSCVYNLVGKKILTPKMACWQLDIQKEKQIHAEEQLNHSWYDVTISPVYNEKGVAEKFAVNIRNITARKQAEEQVRNNAEYFRLLIEEASEVVVMLNPDGTFAQPSPSFKRALGLLENEDLKQSFFDHVGISDYQQAKQVFSETLVHPGMSKPIRLTFETSNRTTCIIKGIMSNLSDNPFVGKIVLNGWVE